MTNIEAANERAQEAFHQMVAVYTDLGHWDHAATDAYRNAERDVEWEESKARMDELQTSDHDGHRVYGVLVIGCDDCAADPEMSAITVAEYVHLVASLAPGEAVEMFGR